MFARVYRYGFNGMEKDDEAKGAGNSYTTFFRQYDSRLGRWSTLDPMTISDESRYSAFANSPVFFNDPNGDKIRGTIGGMIKYYRYKVKLKVMKANAVVAFARAGMKSPPDIAEMAGINMILGDLNRQENRMKRAKKSEVVFFIRKDTKKTNQMDSQSIGGVAANQRKHKKKGRIDLFYSEGKDANASLAFNFSLCDQFLQGDFSFEQSSGDLAGNWGRLADQNDIRDAVLSSNIIGLTLNGNTDMNGFMNSFNDAVNKSTQTGLPNFEINLNALVPTKGADKASIATSYRQTFRQEFKSLFSFSEIWYDNDGDKYHYKSFEENDYIDQRDHSYGGEHRK